MSRPTELDLIDDDSAHKDVPMPGSRQSLALLRLDSAPGSFVIHGRFPAGFDRTEPGGYAVTEEFLVLDGELDFDGVTYRRGDLVYVPANLLRTRMTTTTGCTVLAWFSGAAVFVPAAEFERHAPVASRVQTVSLIGAAGDEPRVVLDLPGASWHAYPVPGEGAVGEAIARGGDIVDAALTRWSRVDSVLALPADGFFVRSGKA